jgi:hypothetical protein
MLVEHDMHIEYSRSRSEQLHRAWPTTSTPARYALGGWLVRLGRRLAPEPKPASGFSHEALPRC